jgi:hypothetical protein
MAAVGDQIEVSSNAGPRSGVVTGVNGPMIVVCWSTGEETSFVPGPGVLSVVKRRGSRGTSRVRARTGQPRRASKSRAVAKKPAKTKTRSPIKRTATPKSAAASRRRAVTKKPPATSKRRTAAKKAAKIKTRSPVKRTGTPKRTATKKPGTKRATVKAAKRGNTNASTGRRPAATTKARGARARNLKAATKATRKSPAKKAKRAAKSR